MTHSEFKVRSAWAAGLVEVFVLKLSLVLNLLAYWQVAGLKKPSGEKTRLVAHGDLTLENCDPDDCGPTQTTNSVI